MPACAVVVSEYKQKVKNLAVEQPVTEEGQTAADGSCAKDELKERHQALQHNKDRDRSILTFRYSSLSEINLGELWACKTLTMVMGLVTM